MAQEELITDENTIPVNTELLTKVVKGLTYHKKDDTFRHSKTKYKLSKAVAINEKYGMLYFVNIFNSEEIKTVKVGVSTGIPTKETFNNSSIDKEKIRQEYQSQYYLARTKNKRKNAPKKEYKHECPVCHKKWTDNQFNKVFCSEECHKKHVRENYLANTNEEITCKNCGKTFTRTTKAQHFCKKDCYLEYNRKMQKERNAKKKKAPVEKQEKVVTIEEKKPELKPKKNQPLRTPKRAIVVKKGKKNEKSTKV